MKAVLNAEGLEDGGAKTSDSESWAAAAREALAAQRRLALARGRNEPPCRLAETSPAPGADLDGLLAAGPGPKDDPVQGARAKAAAALVEARESPGRRGAAATPGRRRPLKAPLTTEYTPRPLEFPRAKTTYRDTPSNAPYAKVSTGRRLALARWIVDRRNPLTARVAVNHVWARHFGEPLVGSVVRFRPAGRPGPNTTTLLDWLAVEFMESGWSLKHLHRLIVTSRGLPDERPSTPAPTTRTSPSTPTIATSGG